jgi:hypothetical protein
LLRHLVSAVDLYVSMSNGIRDLGIW